MSTVSTQRRGFAPFAWLAENLAIGATESPRRLSPGGALFALVLLALGLRGLVFGDFAGVWQRVPAQLPGAALLAYVCGSLEFVLALGLFVRRAAVLSAQGLSVLVMLWILLLKVPVIVAAPTSEISWLGAAEISVILAGTWALIAAASEGFFAAPMGTAITRLLFAFALLPIGLSHFVYADATAGFVPQWLPWHHGFAYLTGAASLVAATALLLGVWPRLAATLEALMLGIITVLVWVSVVVGAPFASDSWSALLISSAIAAGAAAVADSYRSLPWFDSGFQAGKNLPEPLRRERVPSDRARRP